MKKLIITLVVCIFSTVLIAQVSTSERQILIDLYTSTNGENWSHSWDLNKTISEWHGITTEDNKITSISLLFNNMTGELPASIGELEHLEILELSFNKLHGPIPTEIGNLKNLKIIAFNGNDLTGNIPSSLGNLTKLSQLHLSSNLLTGKLPETLVNLNKLEVLNVFDNNLSGKIPYQFAYTRNLRELIVAENNFEASTEFSALLLSNGASINLDINQNVSPKAQDIIAIESEEEN